MLFKKLVCYRDVYSKNVTAHDLTVSVDLFTLYDALSWMICILPWTNLCMALYFVPINVKNDLQYLLSGWCTYCVRTWYTYSYWQMILNAGHPTSQGVGCGLVSVHRSKRCRFHCHTSTTVCWDTQRVSSWATAPQPSQTDEGHRTWVSLSVEIYLILVK
jgi:hypothetical protein